MARMEETDRKRQNGGEKDRLVERQVMKRKGGNVGDMIRKTERQNVRDRGRKREKESD